MNLAIIPCKNDGAQALELAQELNDKGMRVLVIDDHSNPPVVELPLMPEVNNPNPIRTLHVIPNRFEAGKGSAIKYGFVYALIKFGLNEDSKVIIIDGDGQINPHEINTFERIMELYNADAVIGNKRHLFSVTQYGTVRRIISKTYNLMDRTLFGFNYRDTQCGIKMFRAYALEKIIDKIDVKRFAFDLEVIVALVANNYRIADAPITLKKQENTGSVSLHSIFQTFIDTIKIYGKLKKGLYHG